MRTVFFDIDTQLDFVAPAGALYVPGAERLAPAFARLNRHAAAHGIPVVSTMDAHRENDAEFAHWPPHCIAGTLGQQKPRGTLLDRYEVLASTPGATVSGASPQILVEKQALDCFSNPNLAALVERLGARRAVVYGVVTEYCVRCAALGLLQAGLRVELAVDAIQTLRQEDSERTLKEFREAGGILVTVDELCA